MKSIRTLLVLVLAGLVLTSCGASYQEAKAQRKAAQEAERQANVSALENCDFLLEVTTIIPRGYPSRSSTGEYKLRLQKDIVDTRLPFIGDSHEAAYGTDEISIVFKHEKVALIKDFADAAKGEYRYQFKGGEGPSKWTVSILVYDNGAAIINCANSGGRFMSYNAILTQPRDEEQ